jgi:TPR repeat protein
MYEKGLGVAKNDTEAIRWYRKAADMGYSPGNGAINSLTSKKK